jgi:hypothetical protein
MIKTTLVALALVTMTLTTFSHAQTSTGTTATSAAPATAETTGTIKEYTPGSLLVIDTLAPNAPLQFKLSKNITYADADGKTVEAAGLTTNQKVRVHYTKIGGDNLADKVTVIGN